MFGKMQRLERGQRTTGVNCISIHIFISESNPACPECYNTSTINGTQEEYRPDCDTGAVRQLELLWYSQPYSDFRVPAARLSVILYVIVCILV
jgi:hypothetical protein